MSVAGLWDRRHEPPLPPATARCRPGGDGGRARPVLPGGVLGWRLLDPTVGGIEAQIRLRPLRAHGWEVLRRC